MEKKIFKLDQDAVMEIRDFELTNLNPNSSGTFRTPTLSGKLNTKSSKGNADLPRKDRRFQVDAALRNLIETDVESNLEIETRVKEKVEVLRLQVEAEAREAGYTAGYEQGKSEAKSNFEIESQLKLKRLDSILEGFESRKKEIYDANERFLVELIYRIAGSILQKEILLDPEYLARVVRSVVEKVGVKEQLKLIVSASKIETLYGILPELEKRHASLKNISIESSSLLADTDIVIETDWNRVDATLDSQLGSLHEVVLAALEDSRMASESA